MLKRTQAERRQLVSPFLQWLARLTAWDLLKAVGSVGVGMGVFVGATSYLFMMERGREGVEHARNEDADKALENMDGKGKKGKNDKSKKNEKDDRKKKNDNGKDEKK